MRPLMTGLRSPVIISLVALAVTAASFGSGAQADEDLIVTRNLYASAYAEEFCAERRFSQDEWGRLIEDIHAKTSREFSSAGEELAFMTDTRERIRVMVNTYNCGSDKLETLRNVFSLNLAQAL